MRFSPLLIAFALTACGAPATSQPPAEPNVAPAEKPAQQNLKLGQPGKVLGEAGTDLTLTPTAVMYTKGSEQDEPPSNQWYLVLAITAEATTAPDDVSPPITGNGLFWRGEGITLWSGQGTSPVWDGAVNGFGAPIEPGTPEKVIVTFDVPAKGGRLIYINADQTITGWQLPTGDAGDMATFKKVRSEMKRFGGER